MSILSIEFIGLTLATVIVYYIVPLKVRWWVLLLASAVFYALAGWQGCIWLVLVAAETFLMSLLQQKLLGREKEIAAQEEILWAAKERPEQKDPETLQEVWEIQDTELPVLPEKGWFSSSRKVKKLRKILLAVTLILPFAAMAVTKYYDCLSEWITSMP